jgi:hypothetical protein
MPRSGGAFLSTPRQKRCFLGLEKGGEEEQGPVPERYRESGGAEEPLEPRGVAEPAPGRPGCGGCGSEHPTAPLAATRPQKLVVAALAAGFCSRC